MSRARFEHWAVQLFADKLAIHRDALATAVEAVSKGKAVPLKPVDEEADPDYEGLFLGDVADSAADARHCFPWDIVIVLPNPDHPKTSRSPMTIEEAEDLYKLVFKNE